MSTDGRNIKTIVKIVTYTAVEQSEEGVRSFRGSVALFDAILIMNMLKWIKCSSNYCFCYKTGYFIL